MKIAAISIPFVLANSICVLAQSSVTPPPSRDQVPGLSDVGLDKPEDKAWGAWLSVDWNSKYVTEGVDNFSGNNHAGLFATEVGVEIDNFTASIWAGAGVREDYLELDFIFGYTFEVGPLAITPYYTFYYFPNPHEGTSHELGIALEAPDLPYGFRPAINFYWDVDQVNGGFLEIVLAGEYAFLDERLTLGPYALLGSDFGYVVPDSSSVNNFQFGLAAEYAVNDVIALRSTVNRSIALNNLHDNGYGNEVWASFGVVFSY